MATLLPSEYDASYFDGALQPTQHNAGYNEYKRWYRNKGASSLGEHWKDYAAKLKSTRALTGKKVLELGCAKGFLVEDLVDMGVDAYGLDVSSYAIETAPDSAKVRRPDLASRFFVGDARTALSQFTNNQFDAVFSKSFLVCFAELDLTSLVTELNRISRFQFHIVEQSPASQFYLQKTLSDWRALGWSKGTVIISAENDQNVLIK